MVTHLEPDILECEVKWALGSITTNKASAMAAAKEKGLFRLEGKEYVMQDGDITNFRFNV